jgi:hypothetical protein
MHRTHERYTGTETETGTKTERRERERVINQNYERVQGDSYYGNATQQGLPTLRTRPISGITSLEMANRRPFIAGNWKMNPETLEEAIKLAKDIGDAGVKSHLFAPVAFPPPKKTSVLMYSVLILLHI